MTDTDHLSGDDWKKLYPALYPPDETREIPPEHHPPSASAAPPPVSPPIELPVMVHAGTPNGIPFCVWARHKDHLPRLWVAALSAEYRHRIVNRVEIGQINCPECRQLAR